MKKLVLLLTVLLLSIPVMSVLSADETVLLSFAGESSVAQNRFIEIEVSISGKDISSLKGNLKYDENALIFNKIVDSSKLNGFNYNISNNSGSISFTMSSETTSIIGSATLFKVRFITRDNFSGETSLSGDNIVNITKKTERVVTNQKEIDDALTERENQFAENATEVVIPDPIYEDKVTLVETPVNAETFKFEIIDKPSENSLLKSITVNDGKIVPSFNKFTLNYDLYVLQDNTDIKLQAVAEDPGSKVEVSSEINNQIIVTVTSQNQTVTSYVFKVKRQAQIPQQPVSPVNPPSREIAKTTFWLLIGLGVISASIMGIGIYYIYTGQKEN